ncbi:unnamed protein product, partial [Rotaria sordida]
MDTTFAE